MLFADVDACDVVAVDVCDNVLSDDCDDVLNKYKYDVCCQRKFTARYKPADTVLIYMHRFNMMEYV
jgi:hypothetical protein